jgi:hypothetical protein
MNKKEQFSTATRHFAHLFHILERQLVEKWVATMLPPQLYFLQVKFFPSLRSLRYFFLGVCP